MVERKINVQNIWSTDYVLKKDFFGFRVASVLCSASKSDRLVKLINNSLKIILFISHTLSQTLNADIVQFASQTIKKKQ